MEQRCSFAGRGAGFTQTAVVGKLLDKGSKQDDELGCFEDLYATHYVVFSASLILRTVCCKAGT
jgi:hypothetical protein